MSSLPDPFYLSSSEGYGLEAPHRCTPIRRVRSDARDDLLLVRVEPPLLGQPYGLGGDDIVYLVIASRHPSVSLFPVSEWPAYVHVARILVSSPEEREHLGSSEIEEIAWAEIYPNEESTRRKPRSI